MAVVALAGGGTGGHVYPALAIGDVLKARGHEVLYYGDADRLEGRVAPERGYAFRSVRMAQYPRSGLVGKVRFAFALARSVLTTRGQLKADRVDAVLGVGGYISAPPVLAAWTLRRGRAIHEANVAPGLANKLCARVAQAILMTYDRSRDLFPGSAPRHLVGQPVNQRVLGIERDAAAAYYQLDPARPVVLFVGGSNGAARINELALAVARHAGRTYQVVHLCGPRYHDAMRDELGDDAQGVALVAYEDQMGNAYALADLVVARAGSATLSEITAVGRASLLVPSPNVTENHQEANARGLEQVGAAEVLVEQGWDIAAAVSRVEALMADPEHLATMAGAAKTQARFDAAERAADVVESLLG